MRGRGPVVPRVASVSVGIRAEGVVGGGVRETRVGRTCDRHTLREVSRGFVV